MRGQSGTVIEKGFYYEEKITIGLARRKLAEEKNPLNEEKGKHGTKKEGKATRRGAVRPM